MAGINGAQGSSAWTSGAVINKGSAAIEGLSSFASAFKGNSELKDSSGIEAQIKSINTDFNAGDYDQLMSIWDNTNFNTDRYSSSQFTQSAGKQVLNTGKAVLAGAKAGATIAPGPYGAIIGAAAGLVSGVAGSITGGVKAKRKARELNNLAATMNSRAENNFLASADWLEDQNYYNYMRNIAAEGGQLYNTHGGVFNPLDLRFINAGGTHESNPYGGVLQGFDQQGVPNLVEEGEVVYNDYVFSNRLSPSKKALVDAGLDSKHHGKTYAEIAKKLSKETEEMPNDPIAKRTTDAFLQRLQVAQETQKQRAEANKAKKAAAEFANGGNLFDDGGDIDSILQAVIDRQAAQNVIDVETGDISETSSESTLPTFSTKERYAPVIGNALAALYSIFEKPDYTHPNSVLNMATNMKPQTVAARPIGDYLRYNPIDMNYVMNTLRSQSTGTRRALQQGANVGAVQAALLQEGMNTGNNIGSSLIQGRQYNDNLKSQIAQFNRGTNQYNSQVGMSADSANANARNAYDQRRLAAAQYAATQKLAIDNLLDTARSTNLTTMFDNIGNIGRENFAMNNINRNAANRGYGYDADKILTYFSKK